LFLLFLYSATAPPNLHSFPTRRSSDLERTTRCFVHDHFRRRPKEKSARGTDHSRQSLRVSAVHDSAFIHSSRKRKGHGPARRKLDRKSTRLNSSHLVISYAVFCLKKKK